MCWSTGSEDDIFHSHCSWDNNRPNHGLYVCFWIKLGAHLSNNKLMQCVVPQAIWMTKFIIPQSLWRSEFCCDKQIMARSNLGMGHWFRWQRRGEKGRRGENTLYNRGREIVAERKKKKKERKCIRVKWVFYVVGSWHADKNH